MRGESNVVYSPPGYLIFVRDGTLLVQAFDLGSLQAADGAVPIPGHGGERSPAVGSPFGLFSVSQNGVLAYAVPASSSSIRPGTTGRQVLGAIGEPAEYGTVRLSPDERRLVLERSGAAAGLWLLELQPVFRRDSRFTAPKATPSGHQTGGSSCSPTTGQTALHRKVIGNTEDEVLPCPPGICYAQEWAHDGASILFINQDGRSLYRLPLSGSRTPELLLETPFSKDQFRLSPDGRWIAFNSLESGRWEVYVASFPSFARQASGVPGRRRPAAVAEGR